MTVSSRDVANFYIELFKDSEDPMTKTRLQKFMYFAQAESMARLNRMLFDDDFEAWHYGPVIPRISVQFKNVKDSEPIKTTVGSYDIHVFTPEQLEVLMDVAKFCGKYSTAELSRLTHVPGGPWESVHSDDGKPAKISKKSIKSFYKAHDIVPSYTRDAIESLESEGRIDEHGRLILPEDWE